ncbi:hypothetical protein [Amycolatopsis sp. cg9]|uniref:hypothetical protein n=1 Tax=Amycolatopsis sp. cg9 TaxID=3238801 RepID=UPI003523FC67
MSVVVLTLLAATVAAAAVLLGKMYRADQPLFGGLGICLLVGPGALLAFLYVGLAA